MSNVDPLPESPALHLRQEEGPRASVAAPPPDGTVLQVPPPPDVAVVALLGYN